MKKITTLIILLTLANVSFAQVPAKELMTELGKLQDQFGQPFNSAQFTDKLIVVYVPGSNDPFIKVYEKLKGKFLKKNSNVLFVGGFKEMIAGGSVGNHGPAITKHLRDAIVSRYGEKHFPILIDLESVIERKLSLTGNSIIQISMKSNTIESITDYSMDRRKFLDTLADFFN